MPRHLDSTLLALALSIFIAPPVYAGPEGPKLGKSLVSEELKNLDIHVFPDGSGLPEGSGDALEGEKLYENLCSTCHGPRGTGGSAGDLVGRSPLNGSHPDQSVGNFWPYATTVFDFIRRSMPLNAPRSLTEPQVYALTAYILALNGIIEKGMRLDKTSLPSIRMPNRDGFIPLWPNP